MWRMLDTGSYQWNEREVIPKKRAEREIKRSRYRYDIQDAADKAGVIWRIRRELGILEGLLKDGERVLAVASATQNDERGLLVATTSRIMFVFRGWMYRTTIHYDYHILNEAIHQPGLVSGRMMFEFYGLNSRIKFTHIWNPAAKFLFAAASSRINSIKPLARENFDFGRATSSPKYYEYQVKADDLIANEILALDEAYKAGEVDKDEYIERKKNLLTSMS